MKNSISFRLWGQYALFTDPVTKIGGEKCSYHLPTYEAIKGVLKSIYWKPSVIWHVDRLRVMKNIQAQTKGTKPLNWNGGNSLAIYTFLHQVEYQVQAHFEWNPHRPELAADQIDGKHYQIARRMLERGGRQDVFLGVRDCPGYVEPCEFGEDQGDYDGIPELSFGLMFHGFDYPDETGGKELASRFWQAVMRKGVVDFPRPEDCPHRRVVREMTPKKFQLRKNLLPVEQEEASL